MGSMPDVFFNDTAATEIYTDGACSGNPGPGGWGAVLRYGTAEKEISGGEAPTTNNRMELMAAIAGLEALKRRGHLPLYTPSPYLPPPTPTSRPPCNPPPPPTPPQKPA